MEEDIKTTIISLTPKNYHKWIKEIEGIATRANVWEYVNPKGIKLKSKEMKYSDISEYKVASENNRPAQSYRELTAAQKEAYQMNITVYKMREKQVLKIAHGMRIVDNALKCSARSYIPSDEMTSSCRDIIKILAARYELINNQIIEQIQEKFHDLKAWPLIKDKIEEWVIKWENLRGQIVKMGIMSLFGSDVIYTKEFLKTGRKWAFDFCDSWVREHKAAGREIDFFHITREYRNEMNVTLKIDRFDQVNVVILHDKTQDQSAQTGDGQKSSHSCESDHKDEKFKERRCVCGEMHLFKECLYIVISARKNFLEWKENVKTLNEARQRILKNVRFMTVIKAIIDINILNGLNGETAQKEDTETAVLEGMTFKFDNVAISATKIKNSLSNSVIYDSGCN